MKKILLLTCFLFLVLLTYSQELHYAIEDTIEINKVNYIVRIDVVTHKVIDYYPIDDETFIEKIYIGTNYKKDHFEQKIIYDITDYSKLSFGYDFGVNRITLGVYVSLGKIKKRKYNVETIYF